MKQIQTFYDVSYHCRCYVIATLAIVLALCFYKMLLLWYNDTCYENVYIPNQIAELVLLCLGDTLYHILAVEHRINSKLQPLACYCCGKRNFLSPLPLFSFVVSWLAV